MYIRGSSIHDAFFIEEALNSLPGVLEATVSPGTDTALVRYVPGQVDFAAVKAAVESTGYQAARPVEKEENTDEETAAHRREYQSLMRKFWFAAAVSLPVMLVAYPEVPCHRRPFRPIVAGQSDGQPLTPCLVEDVMIPLAELRTVKPDDDLATVFERMTAEDINQFPVIDANGRLLGMVARDHVLAFLNIRAVFGQQP